MKKYFLSLLVLGVCFTACNKNDDAPLVEEVIEEEEVVEENPQVVNIEAQNFMWQAMNAFYFWQEDVPDLADDRFATQVAYEDFLEDEPNPEDFFYQICYNHERVVGEAAAIDRFSFAAEDYKDLVSRLQGVSRSNGLEFQLYLFQGSDDVYGVVTYIARDSDASTKDIKRGDIFIGVDGQRLNRTNFRDLLFGENTTYTLDMAEIVDNSITENNKEVTLTKVDNFSENPILVSNVLEQSGIKIGYLMYNGFLAAFDEELNNVFGNFKSEGVQELVLDFRYNGGGRVSTAVQIASSVYGTNTNDLFLKARYNNKIQSTFDPGDGETNFSSTTIDGSPINALNLQRVYVITTDRTASASELVINGLAPYVDVVQIGTTTTGKNEFSITFVDDLENSYFYDPDREANINPNNQWGIQPLLGRNENADGFSDYTSGLVPNFELEEDISNLGVLGDPSEPLLALTISQITGESGKIDLTPAMTANTLFGSYDLKENTNVSLMDGLMHLDMPNRK
ncbi:carboxyl-terminal protease [Maribacter sp. 4U21]|uniref:S41 family peptidase n=1 Tax=Maribacter sp. 4U21 TaxID=1889779 RepID=UPI000C652E38|nr:S41 family peptidase [Maribacter sp. 4U21]PIB23631.1 carboxyl-terminal protease [Maribacter sp. 4U21]